ncbi:MAG TPA: FAD-dependent monooxygenase [Ktedonobacteraceae bacterium]|nr:FAD-dependent monooxygenase [Ktedonobacteraceae bacterium]
MNTGTSASPIVKKNGGGHALVIGGSMGGLLAARVLSDYFEQVTIVDRDVFPTTPAHRKGVPQSQHAHALLAAGQSIINQLFPGIMDDLRADGALSVSNVVPIAIVSPAGKLPSLRQPGEFIAFSRYLLEWHVRDRLSRLPGVQIIANTEVVGLLSTPDQSRVTGVQVRERGQLEHTDVFSADLVVDASGRHSQASQWLVDLGYEAPTEETINSGLGYASRFYARPENFPSDWQGLIINGRPPTNPRAGLILPVDNDRWHVSLGGFAGHFPPTDEEGFLQWARDLPDPSIYEALRIAQPLTPIRGYRTPVNHWRHFERLQRWPAGLIVTGDAVCAFNPIYGQGMTVSALDAMTLRTCLQEQQRAPRPNFEQRFQHALAGTVANAWLVSTSEDLRWPGVMLSGARPTPGLELLHRYMDLVLYSAVEDPQITQAYMSVITMLNPPRSLTRPRMFARVLIGAFRRTWKRASSGKQEPLFALTPAAIAQLHTLPQRWYKRVS